MQIHVGAWAADLDEDGILWLSNFNYNGLYKYDFKNREMSCVHRFNDMRIDKSELHREMYMCGSEIFLLPLSDNKIRIYNKKTNIEESIAIPNSQGKNYNTCILENKALLFSDNSTQDILAFDFSKKTLAVELKLSLLCMELIGKKDITTMKGSYGKNLFLLDEDSIILYCIDIDTYEYRTMDVSYIEGTITKVFFYNNKYWFLLKDNCDIYASDGKSDSYIKYSSESPEYVENRNSIPYSNMIQWGETLILLNYYGKYIMKVSEEKHTLKRLFPDFNQEGGVQSEMLDYGACYYQAATLSNNTIYFIPQRATHIIECDKELEITNRYECVITEKEVLDEILLLMLEEKDALMEGMKVATLQRYIDNIDKLQKEMLNSDCGGKIYSEIRK